MTTPDYFNLLVHILRMTSPILLCALAVTLCSKVGILNLFTEGSLFSSAFVGILAYESGQNSGLAVFFATMAGVATSAAVGYLVVYQKANPIIVSIASNVTVAGLVVYFSESMFLEHTLEPLLEDRFLTELPLPIFSSFTYLDCFSYLLVPILWIFYQKTVLGFRLRALGDHPEAARSMGLEVQNTQFIVILCSGALCGMGGALLSLGSSSVYLSDLIQGRGYIAFVACQLGGVQPVGVLFSSLFFGMGKTWRDMLEFASLNRYLADIFPYAITLLVLMVDGKRKKESHPF